MSLQGHVINMHSKPLFTFLVFIFLSLCGQCQQGCTIYGQTPATALPVCDTGSYVQAVIPVCTNGAIKVPGCAVDTTPYADKNPVYYKFTCYAPGTLGFQIIPINPGDDFDWQLFDVTGHNPADIFTDTSLVVTGNWAGTSGITGTADTGLAYIACGSSPDVAQNAFAQKPQLIAGHNYLLMISHYFDSPDGFTLAVKGGTVNIKDTEGALPVKALADCNGTNVKVAFNKSILCSSIAMDGTDFLVDAPGYTVTAAMPLNCGSISETDTVTLTIQPVLSPGQYNIKIKTGSDGNTLVDYCGKPAKDGAVVVLKVTAVQQIMLDAVSAPGCMPDKILLVFRNGIQCNALVAGNFKVAGPGVVTIKSVTGNCANGVSDTVLVHLLAPIKAGGNYTLTLNQNDGITGIPECSKTFIPSSKPFTVADTVSAAFSYNINYGCKQNVVAYRNAGTNGINIWDWDFDGTATSKVQNPTVPYDNFNQKNTTLSVSNGVCNDTAQGVIYFDNVLKASFEITEVVCSGDVAVLKNTTDPQNLPQWKWAFGNGTESSLKNPDPVVYVNNSSYQVQKVPVQLIATNKYNCSDTAIRFIQVISNCTIVVPKSFTPNGDGLNDYLYPLNAYQATNLKFAVYDRYGRRIFYTTALGGKWDGYYKGQALDTGTYVWILTYTNAVTHKAVMQKGSSLLLR